MVSIRSDMRSERRCRVASELCPDAGLAHVRREASESRCSVSSVCFLSQHAARVTVRRDVSPRRPSRHRPALGVAGSRMPSRQAHLCRLRPAGIREAESPGLATDVALVAAEQRREPRELDRTRPRCRIEPAQRVDLGVGPWSRFHGRTGAACVFDFRHSATAAAARRPARPFTDSPDKARRIERGSQPWRAASSRRVAVSGFRVAFMVA